MRIEKVGSSSAMYVNVADKQFCVSYNTAVGFIDFTEHVLYVTDKKWSVTTSKHLNQWLRKNEDSFPVHIVSQDEISLAYSAIC